MSEVFADTFYFIALLNGNDECHAAAGAFAADRSTTIVTTAWILTELGDGLAETSGRKIFERLVAEMGADQRVVLIPPDLTLWRRGLGLYAARPDKEWSLTDCISFVVMNDRGIVEALTGDHHYEQAGFVPLLAS